ncbi:MAG: NAD-glutamate dehydrogenase, partial [Bauldia sp.]|nr:NAD-glutamate dehydrogenase [Bauldia sp.]
MHTGDAERNRLIGAIRRALSRNGEAGDAERLAALAGDLFGHVGCEDLAFYSPAELAGFVYAADSLLTKRKPGESLVRLSDPQPDGGETPDHEITLVELLNDDMPFLVDSTLQELYALGATVRLVAHPIVTVWRDRSGNLTGYGGMPDGAAGKEGRESLIQIHIARVARPADRNAIQERLESLLAEIGHATEDWPAM